VLENDKIILKAYVVATFVRKNIEAALGTRNIKFLQILVYKPSGGD
jgi:hypothetical protein